MSAFAVVAHARSETNARLGPVLTPFQALLTLRRGEVALGRIDVLRSLEGIERGLWALEALERRGVRVLNPRRSLERSHDKLRTAAALVRAGIAHPRTAALSPASDRLELCFPLVFKPRYGSWGREVTLCASRAELDAVLVRACRRVWFNVAGGLVQELVPPAGYDLRVLVAAGRVVGAVHRVAAPGEWRTNVALGGRRVAATPSPEACRLALAAAAAVGGDLVGVDLLPLAGGRFVVIEVNGAVDFTADYGAPGEDVFETVRWALLLGSRPLPRPAARVLAPA